MKHTIRSHSRNLLKRGVAGLPNWCVARLAGQELVAPCYHIVTDGHPVHTKNLYSHRTVKEFEQDLDFLLKYFKPLSLETLSDFARSGDPLPNKVFFLSFDDGFREMSEVVAGVCKRKGVTATFFLTTGFLDNRILGFRQKASLLIQECIDRRIAFGDPALKPLVATGSPNGAPSRNIASAFLSVSYQQRHVLDACAALLGVDFDSYLRTERPYLTREQVAELISDGFSVGGHSVDHPLYADLTEEDQVRQTADCMRDLAAQMRPGARAFAFPFISDGVHEQFYKHVFGGGLMDLAFCIGRMPEAAEAKAWQRFGVESSESIPMDQLLNRHVEGRLRQRLSSWKTKEASH